MRKTVILPALAALALILASCNAPTPTPAPVETPSDTVTVNEQPADGGDSSVADTGSPAPSAEPRVIEINVKNWQFDPNVITVKKGEKVTLKIAGTEGTHGFAVPGLGINISVAAGQKVSLTLLTDTTGEFEFFCSIPCGPGHPDMRGKIVIEE